MLPRVACHQCPYSEIVYTLTRHERTALSTCGHVESQLILAILLANGSLIPAL